MKKNKAYAFWHVILAPAFRFIWRVRVHGAENEPSPEDGACLVCSNHLSAMDPMLICAVMKKIQPRYMAKKELFRIPVVSQAIRAWGAFPVDRGGRDAGVILRTVKMLEDGDCVGIFPQGTRCRDVDPRETRIHGGAGMICSRAKVKVLPVLIKVKNNRMKFLRPVDIYIGKPVSVEEYSCHGGENGNNYGEISRYIFDIVCGLGDEGKN